MSLIPAPPCVLAPWDHRLVVGDRRTTRGDTKSLHSLAQSLLYALGLALPSGVISAHNRAVVPLRIASLSCAAARCDSNPHSAIPPLALCRTARGFLPQGLSNAYRRSC